MITGHVPAVRVPPDHAAKIGLEGLLPALAKPKPGWRAGDVGQLVVHLAACLRLSRREEARKNAEILILRHQPTVLQRHQPCRPKLTWADRALLATLLSVIPKARRQGLRLLVTPDTILRWHRDIVRRRWAARSMHGKTGRPETRRNIRALVLRLAREDPG
jgi:putative transposase